MYLDIEYIISTLTKPSIHEMWLLLSMTYLDSDFIVMRRILRILHSQRTYSTALIITNQNGQHSLPTLTLTS